MSQLSRVFLVALTCVLAVGVTGLAIAGAPGINLAAAKKKSGPYEEFVAANANKKAKAKELYVRAKNASTEDATAILTQDAVGGANDYRIRWYRGAENITQDVKGWGYGFNLPSDSRRDFRVKVKPRSNNPDGLCLEAHMAGDPFGGNNAFFSINGGLCN
jgi:hypothetical protein